MKIFALVVVKNEGDIIYDTIEAAVEWADKVYVMDNMSTDDTWDKLSAISSKYSNVCLWGQYGGEFNEGLRQILYREYKDGSSVNDWWCRLDGDEFYIDNPKDFLKALPSDIDHVYNASFQYYFTEEDYLLEKECIDLVEKEGFSYKRLNWFKCNHSEIRFVKNKNSLCWPQGEGWPCNLLNPAEKRIRLKHFQYRSIAQIQQRLLLRGQELSGDTFKHEIVNDNEWYERRGFNVPQSSEFRKYKVVQTEDLNINESFSYDDSNLPTIIRPSLKKKIKCSVIYLYMILANNYLFKL